MAPWNPAQEHPRRLQRSRLYQPLFPPPVAFSNGPTFCVPLIRFSKASWSIPLLRYLTSQLHRRLTGGVGCDVPSKGLVDEGFHCKQFPPPPCLPSAVHLKWRAENVQKTPWANLSSWSWAVCHQLLSTRKSQDTHIQTCKKTEPKISRKKHKLDTICGSLQHKRWQITTQWLNTVSTNHFIKSPACILSSSVLRLALKHDLVHLCKWF